MVSEAREHVLKILAKYVERYAHETVMKDLFVRSQMISSHREGPSWATAHLAQMTTQMEKESSPAPISSAVAPTAPPLQDLDAPLNLTKPKSSSSGATASSSPGSDSHSTGAGSSGQQEQPLAATAPKLFPPGLPIPRNYLPTLPYAGLPPHLSTLSSPSE